MENREFGEHLRTMRINAKKTVSDISIYLSSFGIKASEKTIYSWETGRSQPTPDVLLDMCEFYGVDDVLAVFGYKSPRREVAAFHTPTATRITEKLPKLKQDQLESIEKRIDTYIDDNEMAARETMAEQHKKAT